MPKIKEQNMKSIHHIDLQPDRLNSRHQMIILLDIAGWTGKSISEELGMTQSRISIIKGSPLYKEALEHKRTELAERVIDKKSTAITTGDPVDALFKREALKAAQKLASLRDDAKSEFASMNAANSILDRAGYKSRGEKATASIEVTEKMANRFEEILDYDKRSHNDRTTKIRITKNLS